MRAQLTRGRGFAAVPAFALAAGIASVPLLAGPAQAAPVPVTSSKTLNCQTGKFPVFDWNAELSVTAITDGTNTMLSMASNNLPGVVPLDVPSATTAGTIVAVVNGTTVTLKGNGSTSIVKSQPVAVPPVSVRFPGGATPVNVEVRRLQYDVTGFGSTFPTLCPTGGGETSWPIGSVAVEKVAALPAEPTTPAPTPTPTAKPIATPTPKPTPTKGTDKSVKKSTPAKGVAKFDCKLQTLGSPFTYNPTVSMTGTRVKADDSKVSLKLSLSEIPGLAPVPIDNGAMKIDAEAMVGGKKVAFTHSSKVTVPSYGKVPVPTLTSTVTSDEAKMPVKITAFKFDFGEMSGLTVYSECTGGGTLSAMTVGIGAADSDDAGSGDSGDASAASTADTLPKTGSSAPLMVIGLWSSAFVLLAVALFLFLPRRNRHIGV